MAHIRFSFAFLVLFLWAAGAFAGHLTVGTSPFLNTPPRISIDVYPVAMGFVSTESGGYWHGAGAGLSFDRNSALISITYGGGFTGINSGGIFAGPLIDINRKNTGMTLDIVYTAYAAPLKISLQRIASGYGNNASFRVFLSGGIGLPYPLLRLEKGRIRHLLEK